MPTDFLPDADREREEERLREQLKHEYELRQQASLHLGGVLAHSVTLHGLCGGDLMLHCWLGKRPCSQRPADHIALFPRTAIPIQSIVQRDNSAACPCESLHL